MFSVIFGSANAKPASGDSIEIADPDVKANRVVIDDDEVRIPLRLLKSKANDDPNFIEQFSSFWQGVFANFNQVQSATTAAA